MKLATNGSYTNLGFSRPNSNWYPNRRTDQHQRSFRYGRSHVPDGYTTTDLSSYDRHVNSGAVLILGIASSNVTVCFPTETITPPRTDVTCSTVWENSLAVRTLCNDTLKTSSEFQLETQNHDVAMTNSTQTHVKYLARQIGR